MLIAVAATATGYAIDAGHKELTHVFAGFYIAGCVIAVLVVQQSGVFTAVIQPPLILFCAVPGAYWLFHGRKVANLKDLLINCGYPLIERFPLMLGTAGGVLLVGLIRWYLGTSRRPSAAAQSTDRAVSNTGKKPMFAGIQGALNSMLGLNSRRREGRAEELAGDAPRAYAGAPAPKPARAPRGSRPAARTSRSRSRHAGPPLDDQDKPVLERPSRPARGDDAPPREFDRAESSRRPRRRPRPEAEPGSRSQAPREMRREPRARRDPYERPARGSRFEPHDRYDAAPERFEPHDPYEPSAPGRRRPAPNGTNGANPTHHPISRARYRGSAPRAEHPDEPRPDHLERRNGPRTHGRRPAQSWEFDS